VFFAAYSAVLLAELLGDKSVYTITSLTSRFRALAVLAGISAAFALKMLVAVTVGSAITQLPPAAIAAASCAGFLITAWTLSREEHHVFDGRKGALGISFASIFLTEWGDPGQLTAALLTVRFHAPLLIWTAATTALVTKGLAAIAIGTAARPYVRATWFRAAAVTTCAVMALITAIEGTRAFLAR
jgi:putative Ca2+/H+ antiporter (TMEM165/GDT1 family)